MTEPHITALASAAVVEAYDEVRRSVGSRAAIDVCREMVKSATMIASGQLGVSPHDFMQDVAADLDWSTSASAREKADA